MIWLALDGLKKEGLLEESYVSPVNNQSRREIIKKAGLMTVAALPVIYSLVAPTAAGAASVLLAPTSFCTSPDQCDSNACAAELILGPPTTFPGPVTVTPGPPVVIPGIFPGSPPTVFPGTPIFTPGPPVTFPGFPVFTGNFRCQ
jgi:hypothetical protein